MTTPARRTRVRPGTTATTGRRPGASRPAPAPRTREATPDDDRRGPAWLRWVILGAIAVVLLVTLVPTARSLARERLKFVKVGDRSYTVIDPQEAARPPVSGASVAAPQANGDAPWYGQIWQSVQLADRPTAGMLPVTEPPTAP